MSLKRQPIPGDSCRIKEGFDCIFEGEEFLISSVNYELGTVVCAVMPDMFAPSERHKFFVNVNGYVPMTYPMEHVEVFGSDFMLGPRESKE